MDAGSLLVREHAKAIEQVISTIQGSSRRLDEMSWDKADYRQEFAWRAVKVALRFQEKFGFCLPSEKRFVYKSLWVHTSNVRRTFRKKTRLPVVRYGLSPGSIGVDRDSCYDMTARIEASEDLRRLSEALSASEWEILFRVGMAGGVREAWLPSDGSRSTFSERVRRIRTRAKQILDRGNGVP